MILRKTSGNWCENVEWIHVTQKRLVTAYYGHGNQTPCSIMRGEKNFFISRKIISMSRQSLYCHIISIFQVQMWIQRLTTLRFFVGFLISSRTVHREYVN